MDSLKLNLKLYLQVLIMVRFNTMNNIYLVLLKDKLTFSIVKQYVVVAKDGFEVTDLITRDDSAFMFITCIGQTNLTSQIILEGMQE